MESHPPRSDHFYPPAAYCFFRNHLCSLETHAVMGSVVCGASGKRADSQCTRDITFAQERGEIDAVAMLGGASCQAGFLVCRNNKV